MVDLEDYRNQLMKYIARHDLHVACAQLHWVKRNFDEAKYSVFENDPELIFNKNCNNNNNITLLVSIVSVIFIIIVVNTECKYTS